MPYSTPGRIKYGVNGATAVNHGDPIKLNNGAIGAAIKQQAVAFDAALAAQAVIQPNEQCAVIAKGVVSHDTSAGSKAVAVAAAAPGTPIYLLTDGTLALSTAAGAVKYGAVSETSTMTPGRGVGANRIRIDLDARDTF